MNDIKRTYSYERGTDAQFKIIHRANGEFVASIDPSSNVSDLEVALKGWILSPDLRKTVEGWLKAQRNPKAAKTTKAKGQGTRGGPVTTKRITQ